MSDIRSKHELYLMKNRIEKEIKTLKEYTNPSLINKYQEKLSHLQKQLIMIEDHINFYPLVCWLGGQHQNMTDILQSTPEV